MQEREKAKIRSAGLARTYAFLAGIGVLLMIAFLLYRANRQRKKANAVLENTLATLNVTQSSLLARNAENELLLKEIHHRVKNNLEVVSSLLALQSAGIDDAATKEAMQEGQNRVQSIGVVHQKLYQGENPGTIEMKDYFINLSESILDSFGAHKRVQVECAMNAVNVDIDTAVPLGLIVNELLTNTTTANRQLATRQVIRRVKIKTAPGTLTAFHPFFSPVIIPCSSDSFSPCSSLPSRNPPAGRIRLHRIQQSLKNFIHETQNFNSPQPGNRLSFFKDCIMLQGKSIG